MNLKPLKNYTFDPYKIFFCILGGTALSLLFGVIGILMFNDTKHGDPLIIYPFATLIVVTGMMNMGGQSPSAKEVFWGWIIVTFGFATLAGCGAGMIYTYKFYIG